MERELDAALEQAFATCRESEDLLYKLEAQEEGRTEEEVQAFISYVTGPGRTTAWDIIASRVKNGEITWRAVAEGQLARDPDVIEAHRSNPQISTPEQIEGLSQGMIDTQTASRDDDDSNSTIPQKSAQPADDDHYFANDSWLR